MNALRLVLAALVPSLVAATATSQTTVFSTDFEGVLPAEITPGAAFLTGVQRYDTLSPGQAGRPTFAGSFLRSPTGNTVTITLTNLPPHNALSIDFLFAAIDSLDGTGAFPSGDFLRVDLDGQQVFRESFANATTSQVQSYVQQANGTLARRLDLGFTVGSFYFDSAYDFGVDPLFQDLAHTASTATIAVVMEGPGIQSLTDESWAMEEVVVSVDTVANLATSTTYGVGCGTPPMRLFSNRPVEGSTATITLADIPVGATFGAVVISGTQFPAGIAPPIPGMSGCLQYVGLEEVRAILPTASVVLVPITIPSGLFAGSNFYMQGVVFAPGVNTAGIAVSNGMDWLVNPN